MLGNLAANEVWSRRRRRHRRQRLRHRQRRRLSREGQRRPLHHRRPATAYRETKLNGTTARDIAGIDLSKIGATDDQIGDAYMAMTTTDGAFVDGSDTLVTGPASS